MPKGLDAMPDVDFDFDPVPPEAPEAPEALEAREGLLVEAKWLEHDAAAYAAKRKEFPWAPVGFRRTRTPLEAIFGRITEVFKDPHVITGGACVDSYFYNPLHNDIDVLTNSDFVPPHWVFIKDKTMEDYVPLEKDQDNLVSVKSYFSPEAKAMVDVIRVKGEFKDYIEDFDIDLCRLFYDTETERVSKDLVRYPEEVALVNSRKNFKRTAERLLKYHDRTGLPVTNRMEKYSDIFL